MGGITSCALRKMKDVVTLIFVVVYRWGWGVGGAMTSCALCKMKDVVMLKMLKMLRG